MGYDRDEPLSNESAAPLLSDVVAARLSRRRLLAGGLVAAGAAILGPAGRMGVSGAAAQEGLLGFAGIPISTADAVTVPSGYTAEVLYAWGDPISDGSRIQGRRERVDRRSARPGWHASRRPALLPAPGRAGPARRTGSLPSTTSTRTTACCTRAAMTALDGREGRQSPRPRTASRWWRCAGTGGGGAWSRPSPARLPGHGFDAHGGERARPRVTPGSRRRRIPPAPPARHPEQLRQRRHALGHVPTCEENFNGVLRERGRGAALQKRYGINEHGLRLPLARARRALRRRPHPNEPNRFGWVVEVDPCDPRRHAGQAHRAGPLQARRARP